MKYDWVFGWYGFNARSKLSLIAITATAFLNTDLAASFGAIVWTIMAWIFEKKPKFLGLLTGSVADLAVNRSGSNGLFLGNSTFFNWNPFLFSQLVGKIGLVNHCLH